MPSILKCEVFRIEKIEPTPGAHSLETVEAFGNPCVVKKGSFKPGDLAVYIPENAIVPLDDARFSFLKSPRIRPIKLLKGTVYSEGLVIPAPEGSKVGDDLREQLRITKWEPEEPTHIEHVERPRTLRAKAKAFVFETLLGYGNGNEKDPGHMPVYGVDKYLKDKHLLQPGERVTVTEKIHGMNFRASYVPSKNIFRRMLASVLLSVGLAYLSSRVGGHLYVGSHERIKRRSKHNVFWQVALANKLDTKLARYPNLVFYGEVFGDKVQKNYAYGARPGQQFLRFFNIYSPVLRKRLPYDTFREITTDLPLNRVPLLYDGPYEPEKVEKLRFGKACPYERVGDRWLPITGAEIRPALSPAPYDFMQVIDGKVVAAFVQDDIIFPGHIREGVVISKADESLKLKLVSEDYKISNLNGTEYH